MGEVVWRPDAEHIARAQITAFARRVGVGPDYAALWEWSVREPAAFWKALWEFGEVRGERGDRTLLHADHMPGAQWFPDARLSFADNLLRRRDDAPAIVFQREDGYRREIRAGELADLVGAARAAFAAAGVTHGDRVAALLPNVPEAIVAMLGATSLGAIWSSCSPDFGTAGILDRFAQIEPRILIWPDAHVYKGEVHDQLGRLPDVQAGLANLERTIVVPCAGRPLPSLTAPEIQAWDAFLATGGAPDSEPFERFPFDHPLYILFSSGTTGVPKCIVHGIGGTLLQHLKEHRLHCDVGPDDRLFYFTTTGWMMWNWLVSGLASGAVLVLFDGNPFYPSPRTLWDLAQNETVTVFGTSAKYLDACRKAGLAPRRTHDLGALRAVLSTGSPLAPASFDWVYENVKADVQLASISGGTDIVACFALGCPTEPVRRGELQCRGLGMRVEVFDPLGRSLVGSPGELVCTAPFPSMPVGFWNDPGDARYRAAYFEKFPGVWRHGDWATLTERGGMIITGRSDATLNPGGVRIGTAEIYRQVERLDEIEEAIAVGQDFEGDERIVLFVRLRAGDTLDDGLRERVRTDLRDALTPRHVPAVIAQVEDIPRTRSGKISELAVREVIHGRTVHNTEALANPEALAEYRDRAELRSR